MTRKTWGRLLLGVGAALVATPLWVPVVAEHAGQTVLAERTQNFRPLLVSKTAPEKRGAQPTPWKAAPPTENPRSGAIVAQLWIPALQLKVPVVQGTSDALLLMAPGHYSDSVLPGQNGTSVIAAHNATYFRHLNDLKPGDMVILSTAQGVFWFQVSGASVMQQNRAVVNSTAPTLDLEACWPLDALYFTPTRYVVNTFLVKDQLTTPSPTTARVGSALPPVQIARWISARFPLSLKDNSIPMGRLTYHAPQTPAAFQFQQSATPLNVERDGIHLWTAFKDLAQTQLLSGMNSLFLHGAAQISSPNPFWGASSIQFNGSLNVRLTLNRRGAPTQMTLVDQSVLVNGVSFRVSAQTLPGPQGWALYSVSFARG